MELQTVSGKVKLKGMNLSDSKPEQKKVVPYVNMLPKKTAFMKKAGILLGATKQIAKHNIMNIPMYMSGVDGAIAAGKQNENKTIGAVKNMANTFHVIPVGKNKGITAPQMKHKVFGNTSISDRLEGRVQHSEKINLRKKNIPSLEE